MLPRPFLAILLVLPAAQAVHAAPCTPIHFAPGKSAKTIEGSIRPTDRLCYTLGVRPGQTVDIGIISAGTNVGATVSGVGDMRDHLHFVADHAAYTIGLGQLFKSGRPLAFSMTVSVR